jgi:hypothetical protein
MSVKPLQPIDTSDRGLRFDSRRLHENPPVVPDVTSGDPAQEPLVPTGCPAGPPKFASQPEARRYVYAVLVSMLEHELADDTGHGWMFGGIDDAFDRRSLVKAIGAVRDEMTRKAALATAQP